MEPLELAQEKAQLPEAGDIHFGFDRGPQEPFDGESLGAFQSGVGGGQKIGGFAQEFGEGGRDHGLLGVVHVVQSSTAPVVL